MRKLRPLLVAFLVVVFFSNTVSASTVKTFELTYNVDNESARAMLPLINEWRQSGEVWCWNEANTEKVQYGKLSAYTYDYELEQIALQRAYEIAVSFNHARPDGSSNWSCTYNGTRSWGECIAAGYSTTSDTFLQWREDDDNYSGQGHRRLMASKRYTCIGIAHVEYGGRHYWVQEFGDTNSGAAATTAIMGSQVGTVSIDVSNATFSVVPEKKISYMTLNSSQQLPAIKGYYRPSSNWGNNGAAVADSEITNVRWTSSDTSVLTITNNKTVNAVGPGSSTLTATATYDGITYTCTMSVTVSQVNMYYVSGTIPVCGYDINGATPKPVLTYDGYTLVEGKDYNITGYYNNTFIGDYAYVTVEGKGGFTGTKYIDFEITKCDINYCTVSAVSSATYTGSAITPEITVSQNGKALTKGTHYTVSYSNNVNQGTAKITINGTGNYYMGTRTITFKILSRSISGATVTGVGNQNFTGSAITPRVTVIDGNKTLTKDTDYTVTYLNNTEVGTATVTITGIGNYSGTVKTSFSIVKTPLVITAQPSAYTGTSGSIATFSVTAQGLGLSYQWQVYSNGTWMNSAASGANTSKIAFRITDDHNGKKYRCVITDSYGDRITSNAVTVRVGTPLSITKQPVNYTGVAGSTATFSITAQGTGLTYQWQVYSDGTWSNSGATGSKTSKISFNVTNSHNGKKYRCIVTDSYGQKKTSNAVSVKVVTPLSITKQPANYTGSTGSTAAFSITASGTGLTYQWQVYSDGTWSNSGATGSKTSNISFKVTNSHNGKKYRCIVTDSYGQKVISNAVSVKVVTALTITKQPVNYTGLAGNIATFSVTASGSGLTYQWQMYSNGVWKNSGATGSKTSKISFTVTKNHNGMKYRCVITDKYGQVITSNAVSIRVV